MRSRPPRPASSRWRAEAAGLTHRSAGLALAVGEAHRRYTAFIGARSGWTGHLFQSRFNSVVMDEDHLRAALRYVALNPVRAGLVASARDWPWSSTRQLVEGRNDGLLETGPVLQRVGDFARFLAGAGVIEDEALWTRLLGAEAIGRPVGAEGWITDLEARLGLTLRPPLAGPQALRRR